MTFPGTLPASLDNTIKKIGYAYDDFGRPTTVTSYSDTGSTKANEVAFEYGPWGAVTKSMQDHDAAATAADPNVQYAYEDGSGGADLDANYVRTDYVTYPGPSTRRVVYYNYPTSGVGAALSRLDNIASADEPTTSQKYASYMFLGAGTMVKVAYPAVTATPGGDPLSLAYGTRQDSYSGFDRFGRVVDQKWAAGAAVRDHFTYAYDRAGNRLYRKNELKDELGELYHANGPSGEYDGLDRLRDFRRGTLSASGTVLDTVATVSGIQEWTLDAVGNWGGFKSSATTQSWDLDQTRAHNKANEIEDTVNQPPDDISGTPNWVDPAYDAAGNMSAGPQPRYETADANTQLYVYDAWNRLTKIYQDADSDDTIDDPGELVATYSYDGQNRRIRKVVAGGDTYDYYYNESWQVLEVRKASRTNTTYQQYVWGVQYIDAPVVQFRDTADDGTLDQALYYTYDGNFNVTALLNTHAAWAERYVYDPYGQVTIYDGTWSNTRSTSAYDNEILYCGYRWDPESGNYHVRRRYLTPPLGRWLTNDLIGYGDGMNRYQYVRSRPTVAMDPEGLKKWAPVRKYGQLRSDNYRDEGFLSDFRHWVLAIPQDDKLLIRNNIEGEACYGLWNDPYAAGTRVTILIICDEDGDIDFDPGADMSLSVTKGNATVVVALDPAINGHKLSIRVAAGGAYKGTSGPTVSIGSAGVGIAVTWPGATYQHSSPTWLFKYECVCIEE